MRRWRGRRKRSALKVLSVMALCGFVFLSWLFTQLPWDRVSIFVFSVVLFVALCFAVAGLVRRIKTLLEESQKIERASRTQTIAHMNYLSPTDFEHYVATLYEHLGYTAMVTRQSGDGGIDIILKNRDGRTAVQVKRYQGNIGRPDIQNLVGASVREFDNMIFVTSSDFTAEAYAEARKQGVVLVNGEALQAMARHVFGERHAHTSFSFGFQRRMRE